MAKSSAAFLIGTMLLLLVLGFIMQISIGPYTIGNAGNPYAEVRHQLLFAGIGAAFLLIAQRMDYRHYAQWCWLFYAIALLLLVACLIPGVGLRINGASRWLKIPSGTLQPSEMAKVAGIIAVSTWCTLHVGERHSFTRGFFIPLLIAGVLIGAIAVEIDLGNAALLTVGSLAVIYAAGTRLRYLALSIFAIASAFGAALYCLPERMGRIFAFMDLEKYKSGDGLQQWLSLAAFTSGSSTGLGVGNSRQKMWSLPYANSDMVSAIIGEEFGGIFCLGMIACYAALCLAGFFISIHAPDRFGKLLGFGLTSLMATQTIIHLGVTTALLPNKGMPLPFVSAGGTNLICMMLSVGILLNIHKQSAQFRTQDALLGRSKITPAL